MEESSQSGEATATREEEDQEEEYNSVLKSNESLQKENRLLESWLQRVAPHLLNIAIDDEASKRRKGKGKIKGDAKREAFQPLNDEEKNDIASYELELVQSEVQKLKVNHEKDVADIKTLMEEVDLRIAETKKDTFEFKRDIIIGAENPRTGKTCSEKMLRFMEEKIRQKESLVEKLRLKNAGAKMMISKLEIQLAQKEELGEVLHLVDFDQLKIENQQYMERIEAKNTELLTLKLSTAKTIQAQNSLKTQLSSLVQEGQRLRQEIAFRKADLAQFDTNFETASKDRKQAQRTVRKLKLEQEDVDQPKIMEYISLKHEVSLLEKQLDEWTRKVELAEMEEKRTTRLLKTLVGSGNPGASLMHTNASGTPASIGALH